MNNRTNRILTCAGLLLAFAACAQPARANLLVDPGFEANPLTSYSNVLTNFPGFQGVWGDELSTITGVENGVTPFQGSKMLHMDYTGSYTQTFQVTDVTSYAALIDSGGATVNLSAMFDVDKGVPAALGGVAMSFFTTSTYGSNIPPYPIASLTLDNLPNTWQPISISTPIPVGTRWLLSQVFYNDASLLGIDGQYHPGYVDAADMTVTPEPGTIGLLVLAAATLLARRR